MSRTRRKYKFHHSEGLAPSPLDIIKARHKFFFGKDIECPKEYKQNDPVEQFKEQITLTHIIHQDISNTLRNIIISIYNEINQE
ncbi:MAG: hypothetical protein ACRCVW_03795 [Brevinema sp.]